MIDLLPTRLFRGHVGDCPDRRTRLRHAFGAGQLRQAEVEDLHHTRLRDEQVGRLDVPMHDACTMRLCQSLSDLRVGVGDSNPNTKSFISLPL